MSAGRPFPPLLLVGRPKCDACGRELTAEHHNEPGVGMEGVDFNSTHVAVGGQTETRTVELAGGWEVDWDPSSEYDLCEECGESWHDQFNAWMQGRKAWGVRHGAR